MRGGTWMSILTGLVLSTGTQAIVANSPAEAGSPYQGIPERNVFGLRPPAPPPVVNPEANKPPPPKLTLTGITTIMGNKRALMTAQLPARPPEPARAQHYMLTEGQRDGDVEVLNIDEVKGTVSVNNHGVPQEIVFEKETPKFPPAPGGQNPAGGIPTPTSVAAPKPPLVTAEGLKTIPTRQVRIPTQPNDPQAAQQQQQQQQMEQQLQQLQQQQQQIQPGQQPVPQPTPLPPPQPYAPPPQPQQTLTPEEQLILMEAERELRREQIRRGEIPAFPPAPSNPQ